MKQFFKIMAVFMFVAALFVGPVQAGVDHYTIHVYKDVGYNSGPSGYVPITSGVQYLVLDNGSVGNEADTTFALLLNNKGISKMANPVNFDTFDAQGKIDFWLSDSETSCDIIIVDNDGGYTLYMNDVVPGVHTAVIDETQGIPHHGSIWFSCYTDFIWSGISTAAADAAHSVVGPYDTGIDFHVGTMINEVYLEMIIPAKDSGDVDISIGFSSAQTAFRNLAETDAGGYIDVLWSGSCTMGELLYVHSSIVETGDVGEGVKMPKTYLLREAGSLNYTIFSGDQTATTIAEYDDAGWGFIHYFFTPFRR